MLITFLPYTVSMRRCLMVVKSITLFAPIRCALCCSVTLRHVIFCSSLWWPPSLRTSSGFYSFVVVWWWWVSYRWAIYYSEIIIFFFKSTNFQNGCLKLKHLYTVDTDSVDCCVCCIFVVDLLKSVKSHISSCFVSLVGDRGVRLQPPLPVERADSDLREPNRLQTSHPQSHHAGSPHVLPRQHLLLHPLPDRRWHYFFFSNV